MQHNKVEHTVGEELLLYCRFSEMFFIHLGYLASTMLHYAMLTMLTTLSKMAGNKLELAFKVVTGQYWKKLIQ